MVSTFAYYLVTRNIDWCSSNIKITQLSTFCIIYINVIFVSYRTNNKRGESKHSSCAVEVIDFSPITIVNI